MLHFQTLITPGKLLPLLRDSCHRTAVNPELCLCGMECRGWFSMGPDSLGFAIITMDSIYSRGFPLPENRSFGEALLRSPNMVHCNSPVNFSWQLKNPQNKTASLLTPSPGAQMWGKEVTLITAKLYLKCLRSKDAGCLLCLRPQAGIYPSKCLGGPTGPVHLRASTGRCW